MSPGGAELETIAASLLGEDVAGVSRLAGGSLSDIWRVRARSGRSAVVKRSPRADVEAEMLRAMGASGAPVPAVIGVRDDWLFIEHLPSGGTLDLAWASVGHALRTLHGAAGRGYGWPDDYAFGPVEIENGATNDWPTFWAERRLLPHVRVVRGRLARRIETLAGDLHNRLPRAPRPALLHGDLWGGNVLVAGGSVSGFIDPACYHGHVEVDIAMLSLFDRPRGDFHDAYGPLEAGYADRLVVYQLWPALVHLRLFGSGYAPMVERLLGAAGV